MDVEQLRNLAEEVRCAMCFELFKEPRVLKCQHSYCTECLELLESQCINNIIICPLCRFETDISESGIHKLPLNHSVINIISHLQSEDIKRAISPDINTQLLLLESNPPTSSGIDFSIISLYPNEYSSFKIPRDLNEIYTIIPEKIESFQAVELLNRWIKSLWFTPSELKNSIRDNSCSLLLQLIPYYIINYDVNIVYNAEIESKSSFSSNIKHFSFEKTELSMEYIICASSNSSICSLVGNIDFSSYNNDKIDTSTSMEINEALPWFVSWRNQNMDTITKKLARKEIQKSKKYSSLHIVTNNISNVSYSLFYCPFYLTSYQYDNRTYEILISAIDGKIYGERPYGIGKVNFSKFKNWFS